MSEHEATEFNPDDFMGWDGDALVLTDAGLDKFKRPHLSPSAAKSVRGCQASFAAGQVTPWDESPFADNVLGTGGHSVLEAVFGLPPELRTTHVARGILFAHVAPKMEKANEGLDTAAWISEVWRRTEGLWTIENPADVVVRTVEERLEKITVGGVPMKGFVDRVDDGPNGPEVADYKTGKRTDPGRYGDDQGDQIRIYVAGYEAKHGERPTRGRLLYTQHGTERDVDLSPAAMAKTLDEFAGSWEITERLTAANRFPTKTGPLCGWCSYVKCCPTALAQGRGPSERSKNPLLEIRPFARSGNRPRPAHIGGDRPKENQPMTEELKPWVETYDNGVLNPNSYAAQAVYSLVTIATGELHKAGQPITGATVSALSETLGVVVRDVAAKLNVDASLQSGSHSRIRHALYTALETLPLPWGPDTDAWATWADALTRRTFGIAVAANKLHASLPGLDAAPFGVLAEHTKAPRKRNRRSTDPKPSADQKIPAEPAAPPVVGPDASASDAAPAGGVNGCGVLVDTFDETA